MGQVVHDRERMATTTPRASIRSTERYAWHGQSVLVTGVNGREQQVLIERVGIEDEFAPPLNPFGVH